MDELCASRFPRHPPFESARSLRGSCAVILILVIVAAGVALFQTQPVAAGDGTRPLDGPGAGLLLRVIRTGPGEASVLGVATSLNDTVVLIVDGLRVANRTPVWNLDYWFLHVPVSDGSVVQTRIGSALSPAVPVPAYAPRPVGPPGFVYARGTSFMVNNTPIQFFGVNEPTAFPYALIASGLYGWANASRYWGENRLFPSGPDARIANVSSADELWRAYFRYLLHYQNVSSEPFDPSPNLLRIWIVDENFGMEQAYRAWRDHPAEFWGLLDRLVYWADRAGVYLVPVLGHMDVDRDNAMYDPSSPMYARHLDLVRAIVARYDDNPRIAMWDLWNEADVNNDAYWTAAGGIAGYRAWAARYLADVKRYSPNHLLTLGTGGWTLFPGAPGFGWSYHFFWNEIPGMEVSSHHNYATSEDAYLIDWQSAWHEALGLPHFEGEYGYNDFPGPSGIGVGYWPWFTNGARAAGWQAISAMVLLDNGRGAYADYPYDGSLPQYPAGPPPPVDRPPVAAFTVSPPAPTMRSLVTFNASISSDDVGIVRYEWAFGDHGFAQGVTVQHVFPGAGDFPVTLTVTDISGGRDTWTLVVHVSPLLLPPGPLTVPWAAPRFALALLVGIGVPGLIHRVLPIEPRVRRRRARKARVPPRVS